MSPMAWGPMFSKAVPSMISPIWDASFPPSVSTNWPIVILDGMAWGLIMTSGTTPSTVKGMSSCGTRSPITPFCPWREANLSPSSGTRRSLTFTLTSLLPSMDSVTKTWSIVPCSEGLIVTEESRFVGPFASNSRYSSMNLGGLVRPTRTVLPVASASGEIIPSSSMSR